MNLSSYPKYFDWGCVNFSHIIRSVFKVKPYYFCLEFQNLGGQLPTELAVLIFRLLGKLTVQQSHILLQSAKAALKWSYFKSALAWCLLHQEIEISSTLEFTSNHSILRHTLFHLYPGKKYHLRKRNVKYLSN